MQCRLGACVNSRAKRLDVVAREGCENQNSENAMEEDVGGI